MGIEERLAHNFPEKKKEKKKNIPSSTNFSHSSCQVLLLCVVVASILFASTKIYLLLNQNCKERKKEKVPTPSFSGWRFSDAVGMAVLGLGFGRV